MNKLLFEQLKGQACSEFRVQNGLIDISNEALAAACLTSASRDLQPLLLKMGSALDTANAKLHAIFDVLTVQHPFVGAFLLFVGIWKLSQTIDSLFSVLTDTLIPRAAQLEPYKTRGSGRVNASWAVVTGCTAGIGEEYAHQLAADGFNLILVSRSLNKLEKVRDDIKSKFSSIEIALYVLDAAKAKSEDYAGLRDLVASHENVSVLINNLGISHDMPTPFAEVPEAALNEIIQVNCVSTLEISKAVLPSLEKHTEESRSARALVLTMGSMAGLTPTPLLSVYTGSKMFLQGWSSALAQELKPKKIDVQLVLSYLVTSQMSKVRRTSLMCPNPKSFVKSALRQIGRRGGARERAFTCNPYWSHALLQWAIESTLGVWSSMVASINFKMHLDIRKRALRKLAKTK